MGKPDRPTERRRWPRWLLARRAVQLSLLAAFAGAPWWGPPLVQGTLASSRWFGALTLTDPFVLLQSVLAGHAVAASALVGALLVAAFFALLAGRLYCGWVCPINLVADAADALRRRFGWRRSLLRVDPRVRHVVLVLALAASAAAGTIAWELVNPITATVRALAFGLWTAGIVAAAAVFCFDFTLLRRGWCGHVCPVGTFYGLLGRFGRLHVKAPRAGACTHCGDCFDTCPVPHVIAPVLQPGTRQMAIADVDCLRCGRCIDRCGERVFAWDLGRLRR